MDVQDTARELISHTEGVVDALRSRRARTILDRVGEMPESQYLDVAALAAQICDVPVAAVSLIDDERIFYKALIYRDEIQNCAREDTICNLLTHSPDQPLIIWDAQADRRICGLPFVNGSYDYIKFYHGLPLTTSDGMSVGTLCVADRVSRRLRTDQEVALGRLRGIVMVLLGC